MSHDAVVPFGAPQAPTIRRSSVLAALAFVLFLASLLLPAVHMFHKDGGGWLVDLNGAMALYASVVSTGGMLVEAATQGKRIDVPSIVCCCAALSNVLLLLPLAWLRRSHPRAPSRRMAMAWGVGTALALASPLATFGTALTTALGVGYIAWIAAWLALGAALLSARRESVTP